jgi:hypothetical protein
MRISDAFPSPYIKAEDLRGKDVNVDIVRVTLEEGQSSSGPWRRPIVYFLQASKGLMLNVTNARTIAQVTGSSEMNEWIGHRVTLYPTETQYEGRMVPCIRVRAIRHAVETTATSQSTTVVNSTNGTAGALPHPDADPLQSVFSNPTAQSETSSVFR